MRLSSLARRPDPDVPRFVGALIRRYGEDQGRKKALEFAAIVDATRDQMPEAESASVDAAAEPPVDTAARREQLAQAVLELLAECLPPVLERLKPELTELLGREASVRDFVLQVVAEHLRGT